MEMHPRQIHCAVEANLHAVLNISVLQVVVDGLVTGQSVLWLSTCCKLGASNTGVC